jgi:hypothetical protein
MERHKSDNHCFGLKDGLKESFLAYHGTTSANAVHICNVGFDPTKFRRGRYGRGFYLAQNAATTIGYRVQWAI